MSEPPEEEGGCCGGGGGCGFGVAAEDLEPVARKMVGSAWSAKIYASKPRRAESGA